MARSYKKWEDHSPRWQREQSRKGLDGKRWNAWLKLSEKTRKTSDPIKYASGVSVANQRREVKESQLVARMMRMSHMARKSTIELRVSQMTMKDLDWSLKASDKQLAQRSAAGHFENGKWIKPANWKYAKNPWWYR